MKPYSDEDILRYVDGNMDEPSASQLRNDINNNAQLSQRVDAMLASQLPYSMAYKVNPAPEMPESLRQTVSVWSDVARNSSLEPQTVKLRGMKVAAVAAAVGLSFALGFGAANLPSQGQVAVQASVVNDQTMEDTLWVQRVADYQSLYVAQTVNDIQNGRTKAEELLARSEIKDVMDAKIPDLSDYDYQFVRAQQLGFQGQPLIQLVYTSAGKKPLALCFMPSKGEDQNTITVALHEELVSASWRKASQRFVIVADESYESIESIARHAQRVFL
ncbi:MAG: hypothetical protein AB8B84_09600 [Granulosicoccus sp.]